MKAYYAFSIALFLACQFAFAEDINWINPAGGNWNDPANWDLARLPTDQDAVTITASNPLVINVPETPMYLELNIFSGDVTLALGDQVPWISVFDCKANPWPMRTIKIAGNQQSSTLTVTNGIFFSSDESCDNGVQACIYINVGFGTGSTGNLHLINIGDGQFSMYDSFVTIGYGENSVGYIEIDSDSTSTFYFSSFATNSQSSAKIKANRTFRCERMYVDSLILEHDVIFTPWEWLRADELVLKEGASLSTDDIESDHITLSKDTAIGYEWLYGPTIDVLESPVTITFGYWIDNAHLNINIDNPSEPIISNGSKMYIVINPITDIYSVSKSLPPTPSLITLINFVADNDFRLILGSFPPDGLTYSIASDSVSSTLRIAPPNWNPADLNFDGDLNFFDISAFLVFYLEGSPWANITEDDGLNFFDVSAFLVHFATP